MTAAGLLLAFWPQFSTGFHHYTADRFDGLIAAAIQEHWYAFLTGSAEAWNKVPWFHPWPNTLALNDGYFLHGLLHSALRAAGLPLLLSIDITGIILKSMIAPAAYLIARRHLAAPVPAALLAALLSLAAGNLLANTGHGQFFALGPATLLALLALEAGAALRAGRTRHALATGIPAAILAGLLLLTSFYVTYVLLLVALLATGWNLALRRIARQPVLPSGRAWLWPVAAIALAGFLAALPALLLYLPQIRANGVHSLTEARGYAPTPMALLSPGLHSRLWAWTGLGAYTGSLGPFGYGPLVLLAAILGTVAAWHRAMRPGPQQAPARLVAALGLVALGLMVLITNWRGVWLWLPIWHVLPGIGAFRVTGRIALLVAPAVMLVAAWWLTTLRHRAAAVLLGALLVAEQLVTPYYGADRRAEEARLAAIANPPADCRVFVATRPREGTITEQRLGLYSPNVDAMIAASALRLPTINGFSTFNPPGWNLADPSSPTYPERAMQEAARHNLTPCGLDFEALRWSPTGRPFEAVPAP